MTCNRTFSAVGPIDVSKMTYFREGHVELNGPELQTKSVHTRLVHLGSNLCVFLGSDFLDRCGDRRLIVEL
jgi:hypothetical protein